MIKQKEIDEITTENLKAEKFLKEWQKQGKGKPQQYNRYIGKYGKWDTSCKASDAIQTIGKQEV